jgi:hypothetical protein
MAQNVQIPARKPAVIPQVRSVFGSLRNMARLADINREKTRVNQYLSFIAIFDLLFRKLVFRHPGYTEETG